MGRALPLPEQLPPVLLLLLCEEEPEAVALQPQWAGAPRACLLQLFNARGLTQAVDRLLAAAASHPRQPTGP